MTPKDYEFMRSFMEAQDYITSFKILDPKQHEITHNMDRFRAPFVGHPGNYVDIYADCFGFTDPTLKEMLRTTPWLTVPKAAELGERNVVVNRTGRWVPAQRNPVYDQWKADGVDANAIFVGLPNEYEDFKKMSGWDKIEYKPTKTLLEVAEIIAGSETFIGNQSVALSIAIGLGKEFYCEARRDLPIERNECYFPEQPNGNYF
jgi:ADP-heptose:LPS heptosyltransferase